MHTSDLRYVHTLVQDSHLEVTLLILLPHLKPLVCGFGGFRWPVPALPALPALLEGTGAT